MRRIIGCCVVLLLSLWVAGCAPGNPARATIVLIPSGWTCKPVTIPYHLDVSKRGNKGEMIWDIADALCPGKNIAVAKITFKEAVVDDVKAAGSKEQAVTEDAKAEAGHKKINANAKYNVRYKYTVTLTNGEVEDPEIEVWP